MKGNWYAPLDPLNFLTTHDGHLLQPPGQACSNEGHPQAQHLRGATALDPLKTGSASNHPGAQTSRPVTVLHAATHPGRHKVSPPQNVLRPQIILQSRQKMIGMLASDRSGHAAGRRGQEGTASAQGAVQRGCVAALGRQVSVKKTIGVNSEPIHE